MTGHYPHHHNINISIMFSTSTSNSGDGIRGAVPVAAAVGEAQTTLAMPPDTTVGTARQVVVGPAVLGIGGAAEEEETNDIPRGTTMEGAGLLATTTATPPVAAAMAPGAGVGTAAWGGRAVAAEGGVTAIADGMPGGKTGAEAEAVAVAVVAMVPIGVVMRNRGTVAAGKMAAAAAAGSAVGGAPWTTPATLDHGKPTTEAGGITGAGVEAGLVTVGIDTGVGGKDISRNNSTRGAGAAAAAAAGVGVAAATGTVLRTGKGAFGAVPVRCGVIICVSSRVWVWRTDCFKVVSYSEWCCVDVAAGTD